MRLAFYETFLVPGAVLILIVAGFLFSLPYALMAGIGIGLFKIARDSFAKIREGQYSLDYIAFLAMVVALFSGQYLAGAVVSLMITGGEALDEYASARAESALRALVERIPKTCLIRLPNGSTTEKPIQAVQSGEVIIVKPNELIPLDGTLRSNEALLNEANLTGEAIPVSLVRGTFVKSGSINVGETLELAVEGAFENSTYMRIVHLVEDAKKRQARVVRLAEQVNFPFTAAALVLAGGAFAFSGELWRALAVLVIATPCPLIIAAPVAFIGGLSRAARHNIIVKSPAALEALSRARTVFFDKTGTLTLGEPRLTQIEVLGNLSEMEILSTAAAIEFHSIHPLARAIQAVRSARKAPLLESQDVVETIGKGIAGTVNGLRYTVTKAAISHDALVLSLLQDEREVGRFHFEDILKENVSELFENFRARGIAMEILTGDKLAHAQKTLGNFGIPIHADQTPETKFAVIDEAKKKGPTVMVGDGLNDAPALAHATVGIVFSGTENSAAIEAAGVVILGRDVGLITVLFDTAQRAMRVASESIWGGVALSTIGMIFAALGFIPPVIGALIQEGIDIVVILNSLRAASAPREPRA